ncbi:MAG: hypothetical protein IRZ26_02630 [Clostridia bacterium]|nr:hypothetical protein [Clostridia bacterium]
MGWLPPLLTAGTAVLAALACPLLRRLRLRTAGLLLALTIAGAAAWALAGQPAEPGANLVVLAVAILAGRLLAQLPRRPWAVLLIALSVLDIASFASGAQARPVPATLEGPATLANLLVVWSGGHWREGLLDLALMVAFALRLTAAAPVGTALAWLLAASLAPFGVLLAGISRGLPLVPFYAAATLLSEPRARPSK